MFFLSALSRRQGAAWMTWLYVVCSVLTCIVHWGDLGTCVVYSVYIDLNTEVILDVVFQLIKICFAIRMTIVNDFLFLTQPHI